MFISATVRCECGGIISISLVGPQSMPVCPNCEKRMSLEKWDSIVQSLDEFENTILEKNLVREKNN